MTLDEAIQHCREVIKSQSCSKCPEDHYQLQKWLEELKRLKNDNINS